MCHRVLKFARHNACGHNSFLGDSFTDCRSTGCILSAVHPPSCHSTSKPCTCRRYYSQPERLISHQVPGKCPMCPQ